MTFYCHDCKCICVTLEIPSCSSWFCSYKQNGLFCSCVSSVPQQTVSLTLSPTVYTIYCVSSYCNLVLIIHSNWSESHLPPTLKHSVCLTINCWRSCVLHASVWLATTLSSEFPQHVQAVCFGPDAWACVYIWVKVRSVSVVLMGTLRHLLSLLLCQTLTETHFLAARQFPTDWPLRVGMWVM